MDDPSLDRGAHGAALAALGRLNRASRVVQTLAPPIAALARELARPVRVLDVASGGGDVAIGLARWSQRRALALEVSGLDSSPFAVEYAARRAADARVRARFFVQDVLAAPLPGDPDVVTSSLFLHHLSDAQAEQALTRMAQAARHLVLLSDLERGVIGLSLAWLATRTLTRSPVAREDSRRSVQAAFTMKEALEVAARAGLVGAQARRIWPRRYLLSWCRP